jgi:precorrin-8X/cobalt-precorrin-8 methylmutase
MPVGFVNAVESKDMLLGQTAVPYITIAGRKGGSSLAASVINALAILARQGQAS